MGGSRTGNRRTKRANFLGEAAANYWLFYYLVYVAVVVAGVAVYRESLLPGDENEGLYTLAAIFGVAAGAALLMAILLEVAGYMVLLIPRRIRELKERGREEGRQEGLEEGREEGRQAGREEGREQGLEQGRQAERQRVAAILRQQGETLPPEELRKLLLGDDLPAANGGGPL